MKGGVLITGSLLWDSKSHRINWRKQRLNMKKRIHVYAPIRYGRKSRNRREINYTMVFSSELMNNNNLGTAYFVPFKNENIKTFKGIKNQAEFLSKAENTTGNGDNKLSKGNNDKWCSIGILFNPNFNKDKKKDILVNWMKSLKEDGGLLDYNDYCVNSSEESILPKSLDKKRG